MLSVLGIYWSVRSPSLQLWTIAIVSLVFYASLQVEYIPLLIVITLINFCLGEAIALAAPEKNHFLKDSHLALPIVNRLKLLWLGIILNVVLLLGFKYVPFFLTSIAAALNLPVAESGARWVASQLIAPLGLSFFTFECIAYLIDVYRGAPAAGNLLEFAAYKLFFPKLIAGPITRYHYFLLQIKTLQFPTVEWVAEGLWLIAKGAIAKALLADRLGILVDLIWGSGNLERAGSGDLWLATFAYGLQIYLDFSGYVNIVRGSAILLGFHLTENFDFPYFSTSIADFWRRWHMTLGDWLRNYLYFPLGGSRQGMARTCLNLLIVMLIAGIWHGAAWGYVVWGGLHGVALAVHRLAGAFSKRFEWARNWWQSLLGVLMAWLLTQSTIFISWIFFRLPNLKQSFWAIGHLWNHPADSQFAQKIYVEAINLQRPHLTLLLAILAASMGVVYVFHRVFKLELYWPVKLMLVPLCFFTVWLFAPQGSLPYIYFDF